MAQLSFDQINFGGNTNNTPSVPFFSLKNDRDEALVRFTYNTVNDFEVLSVHDVTINGKYRKVSCLSGPYDPTDVCPLCASGNQRKQRFYITMLQYIPQADGTVKAEPRVWERSVSFAMKLKGAMDNYGPLCDMVCKIVRHGAAGNMQTEYEILFGLDKMNPQQYPENIFVKDFSAFEGYKALGTVVLDKSAEDMQTFLATGNFPAPVRQNNQSMEQSAYVQEQNDSAMLNNMVQQTYQQPAPQQQMPWQQPAAPAPQSAPQTQMPWMNAAATTPARQQMPWETPAAAQRPNRSSF